MSSASGVSSRGGGKASVLSLPGLVRLRVLGLIVAIGVVAAACANGTYPLDIFYEMHYQQSYSSHEPPRLSPPASAVPVTGVEVSGVENPYADLGVTKEAETLFSTNCTICHGATGQGDGTVLEKYIMNPGTYNYTPIAGLDPDLTSDGPGHAQSISGFEVYSWVTNGAVVMPSFEKLLSVRERWLLVSYIHSCLGSTGDCPD